MFRFKLTALLLSLLARLGLSEPQYSILDESSSKWLPDDTLLTGLNTLHNSLLQGTEDTGDKKKRPVSTIAAAIVQYLSTDLADEQSKLNSALNARRIATTSQKEHDFVRNEKIFDKQLPKSSDFYDQLDLRAVTGYHTDIKKCKGYNHTEEEIFDNEYTNRVDNNDQKQFDYVDKRLLRLTEQFLEMIIHL